MLNYSVPFVVLVRGLVSPPVTDRLSRTKVPIRRLPGVLGETYNLSFHRGYSLGEGFTGI